MSEIAEIDKQLSQMGLRTQIYDFYEFGKIEQFLTGLRTFRDAETGGNVEFDQPEVYRELSALLGRVHASSVENIDMEKYSKPMNESGTWWNTQLIRNKH